ncbi:hypothetical protein [Plantactinospora veratri]
MKRVTMADETVLRQARTLVPVLYQLSRVMRLHGVDAAGLGQLPPPSWRCCGTSPTAPESP